MQINILAPTGCQWSVSATAGWIQVTGESTGVSLGTARFLVSDNWDAPREGQIVVSGVLPGQTASARVAQAGCVYWVSRNTIEFSASGGGGGFDVLQQSIPITCGGPLQNACMWSATADVPWITITTTLPRTGDDAVAFVVAPNEGAARAGTITVRDQVVRILQAAR